MNPLILHNAFQPSPSSNETPSIVRIHLFRPTPSSYESFEALDETLSGLVI